MDKDYTNEIVCISNFVIGLGLIIFGIALIRGNRTKNHKDYTGYFMIPTGIAMVISGLLIVFGSPKTANEATQSSVIYIVAAFAVCGLSVIANTISTIQYRKKYCTHTLAATCTDIEWTMSTDTDNHTTIYYTPKLEFEYNGETKTIKTKKHANRADCPPIGSLEIIHIDPEKPEDYYVDSLYEGLISRMICGAVFAVPSIAIIICFLVSLITN